jgi:hypothetical protein
MSAACSAIGQIGRVMPLPFPNEATKDLANPGKLDVVNKLEEISNSSNITTKVKDFPPCCKRIYFTIIIFNRYL